MVELEILTRGGIYLAKLNPSKSDEVGKVRPVIILNSQAILDFSPPVVFVCPLSSKSHQEFSSLHFELSIRDSLKTKSYALIEHCRAITINRIVHPRLAQITSREIEDILHKLQKLVGL
jgi:mRNA interferase MazF